MANKPQSGQSQTKRWIWWLGGISLFTVLAIVALSAFSASSEAQAQSENDVQTTNAFIGNLSESATATGTIVSQQEAVVTVSGGLVSAVSVQVGDMVADGETLLQLDTSELMVAVERAEHNVALQEANLEALLEPAADADIVSAEAAVASAQAALDRLVSGPTESDIMSYEAELAAQQANVTSTAAAVNSTLDTVTDAQIASAEANVANAEQAVNNARQANENNPTIETDTALRDAEDNLAVARAALDELLAGPDSNRLGESYASLAAAQANLDVSEANYASFLEGASQADIAAAEASLAQAEATLVAYLEDPMADNVTIAEAQLTQAQIALSDARLALAEATVEAPFAGMVTAVNYMVGEFASGPVVTLMSTQYQVSLQVDEIDIGTIREGQTAVVTVEAWPDVEIPAQVTEIAPVATTNASGLVTYDVTLTLAETELALLAGMTANAALETANLESVLLVPNSALSADRSSDLYTVSRLNQDGSTTEVVVTIGPSDKEFTQITSGIEAGDELLINELEVPTIDLSSIGPGGP